MSIKFVPSTRGASDCGAFILRKPGSKRDGFFDVTLGTCESGPILIRAKPPDGLARLIAQGRRGSLREDPQGSYILDVLLVAAVKAVYPGAMWGQSRRRHETTTKGGVRSCAPFFMAYVDGKVVAAVAPLARLP